MSAVWYIISEQLTPAKPHEMLIYSPDGRQHFTGPPILHEAWAQKDKLSQDAESEAHTT